MIFRLPPKLRPMLARPLGRLFAGTPSETAPLVNEWVARELGVFQETSDGFQPAKVMLACVGDVISKACLQMDEIRPHVKYCFVDGATQRGEEVGLQNFPEFLHIPFENPAGAINDNIFDIFRQTEGDGHQYFIDVEGEEDLLVLPLVKFFSQGLVLYGQPPVTDIEPPIPAGAVGLKISPDLRVKIDNIWSRLNSEK